MMRYIIKLGDKDYGLANGMVPLGSCTMKLNSAHVMQPITYPGFANVHPFAPKDQTIGYQYMIKELEIMLSTITHYHKISLQPNSGANGEFAGMTAIMKYHKSRNDFERKLCLIPTSSHGTNPSTANMCGLTVVPINCDANGNVDVEDFRDKIKKHGKEIAAAMITYPSTYGVFEPTIVELCDLVHTCGGMVYLDGANMNAQMGLTSPGKIGADVGHLNLHKTFAIPHGGGGPGIGAIGCVKELAPFLPGHCVMPIDGRTDGAVNGAPYGNAGVLPIAYAYIRLTGSSGLLQCSQEAILNANYMAEQLASDYSIKYRGQQGRVAHEFIIDLNHIKK
jgi:glycine dehydrogenase